MTQDNGSREDIVSLVQKFWKNGNGGAYRDSAELRMKGLYEFLRANHPDDYRAASTVLQQMLSEEQRPSTPCTVTPTALADLEWQLTKVNEWLYFDDSQQKLTQAGFERHPLMNEAFALICQYLDDQKNETKVLSPELTAVAQDMLSGKGEWFSQAIKTVQDGNQKKVVFYELVTAFPRTAKDDGYDRERMKNSGSVVEFDISDLDVGTYHYHKNLEGKHDDLVQYVTSRPFSKLPEEIQQDGGLYLPNFSRRWPVARDYYNFRFYVNYNYNITASRGVRARSAPAPSTGNKG